MRSTLIILAICVIMISCDMIYMAMTQLAIPEMKPPAIPEISSSSSQSPITKTVKVPRFHEVLPEIIENDKHKKNPFETSYNLANVVSNQTSWFTPQKICHETCCAETVAISLQQESQKIINTIDGFELADVQIQYYSTPSHGKYQASPFHEDMLPCLQPGTIIQLENYGKILNYFFQRIRPSITVPYVLITSQTDRDSPPPPYTEKLKTDDLMLHWYGTNPDIEKPHPKFTPMPLGLSIHHPQERLLKSYLEVTNYTNPFRNKDRWLSKPTHDLSEKDIFVRFGNMDRYAKHRKAAWKILCGKIGKKGKKDNRTNNDDSHTVSCVNEQFSPMDVYTAASSYLFAVSPPGLGYDCYRTYEWLLLGVIPIIMEGTPASTQLLFEDLPVVILPEKDMYDKNRTRGLQKYITAIQNYTQSTAFLDNTFDKGWKRLFLHYWRQQILRDAGGRHQHIVQDEHGGNDYHQVWKYTRTTHDIILCSKDTNCNVLDEESES